MKWIACRDRMPEIGRIVLVDGGIAVFRRDPDRPEGKWFSLTAFDWPGSPIQWEVTHWMPLPDSPPELPK